MEWWDLDGWWDGGVLMDGREQKVGRRGCEGWRPFAGGDWDKAENAFSFFSLSRPQWVALHPTHIPHRPKKKPLREKKVGFAEKKTAPMACRTESCVVTPERWGTAVAKQLPKNDALLQFIRCLIVECGGL